MPKGTVKYEPAGTGFGLRKKREKQPIVSRKISSGMHIIRYFSRVRPGNCQIQRQNLHAIRVTPGKLGFQVLPGRKCSVRCGERHTLCRTGIQQRRYSRLNKLFADAEGSSSSRASAKSCGGETKELAFIQTPPFWPGRAYPSILQAERISPTR